MSVLWRRKETTAGGPSRNRAGGPAFFAGPPVFYSGAGVWEMPAAACPPQGRIGCDPARPLRFVGAHSVRPPGSDARPVSGLRTAMTSKQSPLYLGTPWGAFLARSLASPLQTAPAALGCRLGPPAAACLPQGRIGCVSLRRGAQCAPVRVGRPACIRFENRHDVEAKSALSRNALGGIPRPLPCFSSPNGTRCAGLPFGGRLRRLIPRPA